MSTPFGLGSLQSEDTDSEASHGYRKRDHKNAVEGGLEPESASG